MKLYSWNVNGIRAAYKKGFGEWLNSEKPDVLCLQETKAQPQQLEDDVVNPAGYHANWFSAEKKGYSGVVTFSKKQPGFVSMGIGKEIYDYEGRVLRTDFDSTSLLNIYFPNAQRELTRVDFKMEFCDMVLQECNRLVAEGRQVIVTGDYNTAHKEIDLKNPKSNQKNAGFLPIERAWIDTFIENGYTDTLRMFNDLPGQYSWWSYRLDARQRNIGWRLDYFFVSENMKDRVKAAGIMPEVMGSDHCPVYLEIE